MKDLFKKYHRRKVLTNLWILSLSAILAVSINMTFLGGQNGDMLKASIVETWKKNIIQNDFIIEQSENTLSFKNTQVLNDASWLSFSLAYDGNLLDIKDEQSDIAWIQIDSIKNEDGFINYILQFESADTISAGSTLMSLPYEKTQTGTVHLNIINVNFSDKDNNVYSLTSEGIIF